MPNVDLLDRTMKHIEENEVGWNQSSWRSVEGLTLGRPQLLPTVCGTAMCFAGEAVTLDGRYEWMITTADLKKITKGTPHRTLSLMDSMLDAVKVDDSYPHSTFYLEHPLTGEIHKVARAEQVGRFVLDLDYTESDMLFTERNGMEDLKMMVEAFKEGKDITDLQLPRDEGLDDDDY